MSSIQMERKRKHVQPCDKSKRKLNGERFRSVGNLNKLEEATGRDLKSGNCVETLFCEVLE